MSRPRLPARTWNSRPSAGDVKVRGHGRAARLYVSTVSGDVHLDHGAGDLETSSVRRRSAHYPEFGALGACPHHLR